MSAVTQVEHVTAVHRFVVDIQHAAAPDDPFALEHVGDTFFIAKIGQRDDDALNLCLVFRKESSAFPGILQAFHAAVGCLVFSEGDDLSAYLLERGWAVALPDASIEYQTLEKIARSRRIGIWGIAIGE